MYAMQTPEPDLTEFTVDLEDENGFPYVGRFRGARVGAAEGVDVYRHEDGRFIVVDESRKACTYDNFDALSGVARCALHRSRERDR
jgi:hypothetical protein